jgi:hypothetical protein
LIVRYHPNLMNAPGRGDDPHGERCRSSLEGARESLP